MKLNPSLLLLGTGLCFGQAQPSVDEVLARYVQALGGKAALEKLNSRVTKGRFELPALNAGGDFQQYAKAPNKVISITTVEGYGTVKQAYDGQAGWAQDPERGLRDLSGEELDRMRRSAEFYRALKLKQLYTRVSLAGKAKVGERDAWVLEGIPAGGAPEKTWFDADTGLLVKSEAGDSATYFTDYKAVDGVQLAHTIRQETPQIVFTLRLTEIRHNVAVDDAQFRKPAQ